MTITTPRVAGFHPQSTRRQELWVFWRRAIGVLGAVAVAVVLVLWTSWMAQRYLILGDDTARGERYRQTLYPTGTRSQDVNYLRTQCAAAAEAFYGHGMFISGDKGFAPPNEKAFFVACSGITLGGRGGGQGD